MKQNITLEVCCGSVEDVLAAARGGADRVELNSCLFHGGLTPSVGELLVAKRMVDLPIMTMVRPRQGGFCYTQAEYATALAASGKRGGRPGFRLPARGRHARQGTLPRAGAAGRKPDEGLPPGH